MKKEIAESKKKEIRIITGSAKNKRLKAPEMEEFRAVQEIAKGSLFSILGEKINGAVCLDLFAGSGNLGLEALSRGAAWCDFVDESSKSTSIIEENIVNCGFIEKTEVHRKNVAKFVVNSPRYYDVVMMDPWYKDTTFKYLFSQLQNILNEKGIVALFHGSILNVEELIKDSSLKVWDERKFGASILTLLTKY